MIASVLAFPAHAGMNRAFQIAPRLTHGVPRTRGDEPLGPVRPEQVDERSPHTWG